MSRKHVLQTKFLFKDADATLPQTSPTFTIDQIDYGNIHIVHDPAITGEFKVFVRNSTSIADTFYEIDFGFTLSPSADGETILRFNITDFAELYLTWEPTAATGTITATPIFKTMSA